MREDSRNATANRVKRGGSWNNRARNVRAACRGGFRPVYRDDSVGLSCVRVQEQAAEDRW